MPQTPLSPGLWRGRRRKRWEEASTPSKRSLAMESKGKSPLKIERVGKLRVHLYINIYMSSAELLYVCDMYSV